MFPQSKTCFTASKLPEVPPYFPLHPSCFPALILPTADIDRHTSVTISVTNLWEHKSTSYSVEIRLAGNLLRVLNLLAFNQYIDVYTDAISLHNKPYVQWNCVLHVSALHGCHILTESSRWLAKAVLSKWSDVWQHSHTPTRVLNYHIHQYFQSVISRVQDRNLLPYLLTYLLTYVLTYLLHAAESLRS